MTYEEAKAWDEQRDDASARAERCTLRLQHYITHVQICEGVTFLETKYRGLFPGTHEDWEGLRAMAGVLS